MRKLIYVPIIHTETDMGSMAGAFKVEYQNRYSQQKYNEHITSITDMWSQITTNIQNSDIDWTRVRLYQDGLPVCGYEEKIVTELAEKGSKNHKLLLDLMQQGARLEGTENRELLLKEYNYFQRIFNAKRLIDKKRIINEYKQAGKKLLQDRDRFIAERINQTLGTDEIGFLFMGMMHQVDKYLPRNMTVKFLIRRLPFKDIPGFIRK